MIDGGNDRIPSSDIQEFLDPKRFLRSLSDPYPIQDLTGTKIFRY